MSKLHFLAVALFLPLVCLKAEDKVWKARVTVEAQDGTKTQSVCPFIAETSTLMPIELWAYGQCNIEINPYLNEKNSDGTPIGDRVYISIDYPVLMEGDGKSYSPRKIFYTLIPLALGKDIQVLKCAQGTVTVRLSGSEDKE